MKTKRYLIVCLVLVLLVFGYSVCTKGVFSNHIYFPKNVYEEMWNMLVTEGLGGESVLSTETKLLYKADGFVSSLTFREPNAFIRWFRGENLHICVYVGEQPYSFLYVYDTNTLYGEADEALLMELFMSDYFEWCKKSPNFASRFSADKMGAYTFQQVDSIRSVQ